MSDLLDYLNINKIEPHMNGFALTTNTAYLVNGAALPLNDGPFNGRHATITNMSITNRRDSSASFSIQAYSDISASGQFMFNKCRIPGHSTLVVLDKNMPITVLRDPAAASITYDNLLITSIYAYVDSGVSGDHLFANVSYFTFDSAG